jgi:hypothetical protein
MGLARSKSFGGRIFGALFGLVFAGFGVAFIGFFLHTFRADSARASWPEVACRIQSAAVLQSAGEAGGFDADLHFDAEVGGRNVPGSQKVHEARYEDAAALVARFPVGSTAKGRVNPADASEVVLKFLRPGSSRWLMIPFMLVPLVFVVVGGAIAWASIRGVTNRDPIPAEANNIALSSGAMASKGGAIAAGAVWFIGGMFILVGFVATWFLLVKPGLQILRARSWTAIPCIVESSRFVSSRGDESTGYRPEVLFRFEVDGKVHRSSCVTFFGGSSSGRRDKEDFIRSYPVGGQAICYVDPEDPNQAVLVRGFSPMVLFGLVPLVFAGVGLVIIMGMIRGKRRTGIPVDRGAGLFVRSGSPTAAVAPDASSIVLKPAMSPLGKLIGAIFIALFWNGIVSVFVFQFSSGWQRGRPEWFLGVFMIPFVLIGLGLIGWAVMQMLALANPRPRLVLEPGTPCPGGSLRLQWAFSGIVHRMDRLSIELIGRESATYRRGTDTRTDKSLFTRIPLLETIDRSEMRAGGNEVLLPTDVPPGFLGRNNQIEWCVRVCGEIARWPDVTDEFPVQMVAAALEEGASPPVSIAGPELLESDGLRIGTKGGRTSFLPGEIVEGVAAWAFADAPKTAELRLFWFTEGKGTSDLEVVHTEVFDDLFEQAVKPFRFELPYEPASVEGRLVSFRWAIELVVRAPKERVLRLDLVVSPSGEPYKLREVTEGARGKKGGWDLVGG